MPTLQQYLPFTVLKHDSILEYMREKITLQQYLPFTVLKRCALKARFFCDLRVATVLTVYGIETRIKTFKSRTLAVVATVLTVYGIETLCHLAMTSKQSISCCNSTYRLRYWNVSSEMGEDKVVECCNSTYRLRYWNDRTHLYPSHCRRYSCNSTYRLRYWN